LEEDFTKEGGMKCAACGSGNVDTDTVGYVNAYENWNEYELSQCGDCGHSWKWGFVANLE
jgi:DNA-directed RNA polymerase subunit RPC12/RpoP